MVGIVGFIAFILLAGFSGYLLNKFFEKYYVSGKLGVITILFIAPLISATLATFLFNSILLEVFGIIDGQYGIAMIIEWPIAFMIGLIVGAPFLEKRKKG